MNNSQRFWRSLFFLFLIAALCGGLALPVTEPAYAAPQRQAPLDIVINEVAWAGTIASSDDKWIELYNPSTTASVDISNWRLVSESGSLDITIPAGTTLAPGSYFLIERREQATSVTANLVTPYPWTLNDSGDRLRLRAENGTIIDTANGDGGQWPAGNSSPNGSMERYRPFADTDAIWTTNDGTVPSGSTDAGINPIHGTPGAQNWAYTVSPSTTTTITAHSPNPSLTGREVTVTVTVVGGFQIPTGTVNITDTGDPSVNCTTTLDASGTGSCNLIFTSIGAKTINAAYNGDATHAISSDTETHNVVGTITTITADTPDPSPASGSVVVSVTVVGGGAIPTGTVSITGADTNCTITLNASGAGSCNAIFTSTGSKTITATYNGDSVYTTTSSDTETHTVISATSTGVVISEFRTRGPNGVNDEFIELYNPTSNWIDISGWKINVSAGSVITTRATIPASTILRSGQYYLIANNSSGGYSNSIPANLTYNADIADNSGIALLKSNNTVVDQVGMSASSTYKEGTTLDSLSGDSNRSYERKLGGPQDSCQDTGNNINDFSVPPITPSNPQNYSFPLRLCGNPQLNPVTTTTTITADTPDPSMVNGNVSVSVSVTGGSTPTGTVSITGANTNCTITLASSGNGTGTCTVRFTSSGSKTLTATYLGDNTHLSSTDTESHQVTTAAPTQTRAPTPLPPPPLVAINEFVPRPGHDWNLDGIINTGDEYIELINHGVIDVSLSGYSLDDEVNIGSDPYRLPAVTIKPGQRIVFYGSETGLLLSDGGDGVRLLKPNGQLGDAYNYFVVRFPDQSYCRLPDNGGLDDWNQNCFPTPGLQNSRSGSTLNPPTTGGPDTLCPIADTLPNDFVFAECSPFGNNIWNPAYWDRFGWFDEMYLPESPGKWQVFVD